MCKFINIFSHNLFASIETNREKRMIKSTTASLVLGIMLVSMPVISNAALIPEGDDRFKSVGEFKLTIFDGPIGTEFTENIYVSSKDWNDNWHYTTIHRDEQSGGTILTEMLALDLFGTSNFIGDIHLRAGTRIDPNPGHPGQLPIDPGIPVQEGATYGAIENIVQDPNDWRFISGDSFFDIFFEIDLLDLTGIVYNTVPYRVEAKILCLPPIGRQCFENNIGYVPPEPVNLYYRIGDLNDPNDPVIGQLSAASAHHLPIPEPNLFILLSAGLALFGWQHRRKPLV
ncbi:hypothetical protein [Methylotuvimicrobium sp. KM1]|uniref:hypothetical protein n=1 Tax=Methylotuvimicrobium sp. KM1 TaxID=3377707 RepID=UPI00384E8851